MRKFYLKLCIIFHLNVLFGIDFQDFDIYQYQLTYEEVEKKIKTYLEKDKEISCYYRLTPQALYIGDHSLQQIDYVLYFNESTRTISRRDRKELKGAKIAIDPGHFGGAFAELEERFIKIPRSKTKNNEEIFFAEGDLTFLTAFELKWLLEAEGAIVFVTRSEIGKGALQEDFFTWLKRQCFIENSSKTFRTYYNCEDLRKRAEKINEFCPDITLIIHYNAHLSSAEKEAKELFTHSNYNLAFIPGSFCKDELAKQEDRYEFLRLLLTDSIEQSLTLSEHIAQEFVHYLKVPLITQNDIPSYIEKACLMQGSGVYCRNLALTRLVHSPLCYGETLIQNNEEEVYRLSTHDALIMGIPSSSRIKEVAQAYYEGIKHYFNQ